MNHYPELFVVGGGLAGSEAAWQAAQRNCKVTLFEMRPEVTTGAHVGSNLSELVCSNSLGSNLPDRASGLLKSELREMSSLLLEVADKVAVPAGGALAVDRELFSSLITKYIEDHPNIDVVRQEVIGIPTSPAIIASGPLTSPALSKALASFTGEDHLYFYDAIAPLVSSNSIDMQIVYRSSRYDRGDQEQGDYLNCPFTREQYYSFVDELCVAERIPLQDFESAVENGVKAGKNRYFEGCLPIEVLARRGRESLAFGPLRPIGLIDPRTRKRPYAVLQLRQDNLRASLYNMVGFQTNLKFSEQKRVFRMIPGLQQAEFERLGQMHRNTFIFSPRLIYASMQSRQRADLYFAGQMIGVEGYVGNIATGLLAGWNAARTLRGKPAIILPPTTMLGALCHYITHASEVDFQPMKANFGILPPLDEGSRDGLRGKRERAQAYVRRAKEDLMIFLSANREDIIENQKI